MARKPRANKQKRGANKRGNIPRPRLKRRNKGTLRDNRLQAAEAHSFESGQRPALGFFGPHNRDPFSNHSEQSFVWKGKKYPSSEHAFLPYKIRFLGLTSIANNLEQHFGRANLKLLKSACSAETIIKRTERDPRLSKRWSKIRTSIMFSIVMAKFKQNTGAAKQLVETFPQYLVESSPTDKFWGIGLSFTDPKFNSGWHIPCEKSFGQNKMGHILMAVRAVLMRRSTMG